MCSRYLRGGKSVEDDGRSGCLMWLCVIVGENFEA